MRLCIYECKKRIKTILFLILGVVIFLVGFFIRRNFSGLIIQSVQIINEYEIVRHILGVEEPITTVTYTDIMMVLLSVLAVGFLYNTMNEIAQSIRKERKMGTLLYFKIQGFQQWKIYTIKFVIGFLILIIQLMIWYLVIRRIAIYGVEHVDIIRNITIEQLQKRMSYLFLAGIIMLVVGFCYGIFSNVNRNSILPDIMGILLLLAILPNIFKFLIWFVQNNGIQVERLQDIGNVICKIQKLNPVYFSNPFVVLKSWKI